MRRRPRQLSVRECYEILKVDRGADLQTVKRAYRRRAFELHPDLNPGNPDASRQFQLLSEAYVALSAVLRPAEDARRKDKNRRAASTAQAADAPHPGDRTAPGGAPPGQQREEDREQATQKADNAKKTRAADTASTQNARQNTDRTSRSAGQAASGSSGGAHAGSQDGASSGQDQTGPTEQQAGKAANAYAEQDVLRDLLNDPFARRVFEDIYSELSRQQADQQQTKPSGNTPQTRPAAAQKKNSAKLRQGNLAWGTPKWNLDFNKGVKGVVKDWLRRQIDEEQSLTLPAARLAPGRRVRLQIRCGLSGELRTVEITLPPDFAVGKPVRLRGLGKRVGPWRGDLYLTLYNE
ncbi:J domain-containing protein [uncultured Desulfovibrio sp.]|uniref:J domain-containing protein n=1 Tax=uncultured Desulfovibrio sp. TaxID=167968 RepID=UPI0003A30F81|nr:J domain-containing protein [uncultured Desulfovibrio sp.]